MTHLLPTIYSDVEVWDYRHCPGYIFLDFLVIHFRSFILTYGVGGQPFGMPSYVPDVLPG